MGVKEVGVQVEFGVQFSSSILGAKPQVGELEEEEVGIVTEFGVALQMG